MAAPVAAANSDDFGPMDNHIWCGITFYRVHRRVGGAHYVHDALYQASLPNLSANGHIQPIIVQQAGINPIQIFEKNGLRYAKITRADTQEIYFMGLQTYRNFQANLLAAFPPAPGDV